MTSLKLPSLPGQYRVAAAGNDCWAISCPASLQLRISGFLDTKFDTVDMEFGTSVNELHRPPCGELHEAPPIA